MSSLAGALGDYTQQLVRDSSEDVEMNPVQPHGAHDEDEDDSGRDSGHQQSGAADEEDEEMDDLFGNERDVEQAQHSRAPASPTTSGPDSERLTSPERERRRALEYEEDDAPPEIAVEVKEAEVKFPNLPVPKSSDGDTWVIRMPNFVNVDTKPYHSDTYIGPEQEDEEFQGQSARDKSSAIKLRVENTLRWRWTKDERDQDKRESNARVIRWSDGTLSLRLGKEYFDITQSIDSSAGVSRSTFGGSQSQSQLIPPSQSHPSGSKTEGLTYLFAQHKRSQVLQSEAVITGYMTLRPTGMQSETHRMLVRAVGQKHNKKARLRMAPEPTYDPEREKMEAMKASQRKSKTTRRSALAGLADEDDGFGFGGKKRRGGSRAQDRGDIYTDDEEEQGMYAGDDFEDDDGGARSSSRRNKRKGGEDRDRGGDYQADDFVVPDESDEEDAGGDLASGSRSKKRARENSEEDDLDRMEAKLEKQQAAERKSPKKSKKKKSDEDEAEAEAEETEEEDNAAMDVESEDEEEDEHRVRRATGKRAIAVEEEDEE